MTIASKAHTVSADGITAPLRHITFRRIWLASLLSNLGILIQGVGAAWAMTQMTSSADKVALVQTALTAPVMLISMPAGAIADMYDRRIVALVALSIALTGATVLAAFAWLGLVTPNLNLTNIPESLARLVDHSLDDSGTKPGTLAFQSAREFRHEFSGVLRQLQIELPTA
jgi:Transmembrane secretion effector